ncbi:hypothetical protein FSP39_006569 [Pinctada imbricata]|uniref:Uncharacterized protein n=1 Tax=Pinctada imbricata TaxID=66713 RepID=A0AA89BSJ8_PINIB|nr:hypothetical protein FSP39_006569 [Pinctada imbricata]
MMDSFRSGRRSGTPTLPSLPPKSTSLSYVSEASSVGSGSLSITSRLRKNSAKMRRRQCRNNAQSSSPLQSAKSIQSNISKTSYDSRRSTWNYTPILTEEEYEDKKERLLKHCKLKKELEKYWDVETPSRMERRRQLEMLSDDSDYDTDLDQELVGLELIVDEKTKQIKDDGSFPEYKQLCRKFKVTPNHYFMRHSMDEDIRMKYRYLNPGDCRAMGYEMRDNLTFSKIDFEDNGIKEDHLSALSDMLKKNHYVSEINFRDNPIGAKGAAVIRDFLVNNSHLVKVDISALDISWNNISRYGACALAMGLKHNTQLQTLNASMNGFERTGAMAILEMLRSNHTLTSLDLSANRINDDITDVFARVIPNSRAIQTVKLSFNLISSDGAMKMLKPFTSKMRKNKTLTLVELDGTDVNTELAVMIDKLKEKYGITVSVKIPPSRREKTMDPLTGSLMTIVNFAEQEELDLFTLFPKSYEEKGAMISTDDVMELIKHSGKDISKGKIHDLRRRIMETRDRKFELR